MNSLSRVSLLLLMASWSVMASNVLLKDDSNTEDGTHSKTVANLHANKDTSWLDDFLAKLGGNDELNLDDGIDWGILPGPFVNPLQGFGIGVAAIGLYSPEDRHENTQVSTIGIKSYGSTSGSYGLGIENRTYFSDDTWRLEIDSWISHSPQSYWGIGRKNAESNKLATEVEAKVFQVTPKALYRLLNNTYLSVGWDFLSYANINAVGDALTADELVDRKVSGLTVGLAYDSRDFALNAYDGMLIRLDYDGYYSFIGSDNKFARTRFNYRQYHKVAPSMVLAWELYAEGLNGDIPWFAMSEMGIDGRMRGYYQGQYRDKYQINTQIELRQQLNHRHGFAYWLGAGNVAGNEKDLFNETWLPTVGIGYRLTFKPRVNIRFDMGFGKDSSGFYFQINEAF